MRNALYSLEMVPMQLGFRKFLGTWRVLARKNKCETIKIILSLMDLLLPTTVYYILYYYGKPLHEMTGAYDDAIDHDTVRAVSALKVNRRTAHCLDG